MTITISVGSGKGGTGKSMVIANLAMLLAKAGRRVCVIDLDVGGADIHILYGLFEPDNLVVYVGKDKRIYNLKSFEIEFDCSSVDKMRPRNGAEPLTLLGKLGSQTYIKIINNSLSGIFSKFNPKLL